MELFKRIMALLLTVIMVMGTLPVTALAATHEEEKYVELSDDYLKLRVSKKNGGFQLDTVEGNTRTKADDNKFLLYPDDWFDTSYTSFRVTRGGKTEDFIFGRNYSFLGLGKNKLTVTYDADSVTTVWEHKDLVFTQILTMMGETHQNHGMVNIQYSVQNKGGAPVDDVKVRILLDTALGYQDYGIYQALQQDTGRNLTVDHEMVLENTPEKPAYRNVLMSTPSLEESETFRAYTVNSDAIPDKVAFGHWNNLASTVYDFTPDESLYFTTAYNKEFMTADSAYALYYSLGSVAVNEEKAMDTFYGVYSNVTSGKNVIAVNFTDVPAALELNEAKDAYLSQVKNGRPGDFEITMNLTNYGAQTLDSLIVAVYPQEGVSPYEQGNEQLFHPQKAEPYLIALNGLGAGKTQDLTIRYNAKPGKITDYRKLEIRCYDQPFEPGMKLADECQIGDSKTFVLCPGDGSKKHDPQFTALTPGTIYKEGLRHLYLTGHNFEMLKDTSKYAVKLRPESDPTGHSDVIVPADKVTLTGKEEQTNTNILDLVLEMPLKEGTWKVIIDWKETGLEDLTGDGLQFRVSKSPSSIQQAYGLIVVLRNPYYGEGEESSPTYRVQTFETEQEYLETIPEKERNQYALLEFRGHFTEVREDGGSVRYEAEAFTEEYGDAPNIITINNSLDITDGTITIQAKQDHGLLVKTDIDGKVYTSGAHTKVWDGVCAITDIEDGNNYRLNYYSVTGNRCEAATNNTDPLKLLWPGAASDVQTLAGIAMEFRYCEFGIMHTEGVADDMRVPTYDGAMQKVISFGAQISPDFLVPRNYNLAKQQTSTMEKAQILMAQKGNYTADQLRDLQTRYAADQAAWEKSKAGTMTVYMDDILFGGGFIGFNTSVQVGIPAYTEGMPFVSGALNLKVINSEWAVGLIGQADFEVIKMSATLRLMSRKGIPVPDELTFKVGGFKPGVNLDGMGIFWIQGAGGGFSNMYETLFGKSVLPKLKVMLHGQFSLFQLLSTTAELELSMRSVAGTLSNLEIAGVTLLDELSMDVQWYPRFRLYGGIHLNILDIIDGAGHIQMMEMENDDFQWEGIAEVGIQIPEKVPFVGGWELFDASIGVDQARIWGAMTLAKFINLGIVYYWGGEVDFTATKDDQPDGSGTMMRAIPVAYDAQNHRTLYMKATNLRQLSAPAAQQMNVSQVKIHSEDKLTHSFLMPKNGKENGMLTISFPAKNLDEAKYLVSVLDVKCAGEEYKLSAADPSKPLDDEKNLNANTIWKYDSESKTVNVLIGIGGEYLGKEFQVVTPTVAQVELYGARILASLESISVSGKKATVQGSLNLLSGLNIYAGDAKTGKLWPLYTSNQNPVSGSCELTPPANMPAGTYTLKAVGATEDKSSCPVVTCQWDYTDGPSLKAPVLSNAVLGGNYTVDVNLASDAQADSYLLNIYEGEDPTIFTDVEISKEDLSSDGVLSAGGQIPIPVYYKGNVQASAQDALDENGNLKPGYTEKTELRGLSAGKIYTLGIRACKQTQDGILCSPETRIQAPVMAAPKLTTAVLKAQNAQVCPVMLGGMAQKEENKALTVDTLKTPNAVIDVTVENGKIAKGFYVLDQEEEVPYTEGTISLTNLTDGNHTLTLQGENETGDSILTQYCFAVDTEAPKLMISTPTDGSTFDSQLEIKGFSEQGATVCSKVGANVNRVKVNELSGVFTLKQPMDVDYIHQDVTLWAEDEVGNRSPEITLSLINSQTANQKAELAICLADGTDVTNGVIGVNGPLEAKIRVGNKYLKINPESHMAARINWSMDVVEGDARLSDEGVLSKLDKTDAGMVTVTLSGMEAAAVLNSGAGQTPVQKLMPPSISPAAGVFIDSQEIALVSNEKDVKIYYTLDGSRPSPDTATLYTSPFTITNTCTVKAIAVKAGMETSEVNTAAYRKLQIGTASVVFKIVNGTWSDGTTADKTANVVLTDGKGTLEANQIPAGMKPNKGFDGGSWNQVPDTRKDGVTGDITYTYTFTNDWHETTYEWEKVDGNWTCTASRVNKLDANRVETSKAKITAETVLTPTCETDGKTAYTALFSENWASPQIRTETDQPALGHKLIEVKAKEPTCTEDGNVTYWSCSGCDKLFADAEGKTETVLEKVTRKATGHKWGKPVIEISEDGKTATAVVTCQNDPTEQKNLEVTITSQVKTPATCSKMGVTLYTATAVINGKTFTETREVTDVPVEAHTYGQWEIVKEPTQTEKGLKERVCSVCGAKETQELPTLHMTEKIVLGELTQVPEGLKNTEFNTVEKIRQALETVVIQKLEQLEGTLLLDVQLMITENGISRPATLEEIAARGGIQVVLPYPEGTNRTDYQFTVAHMLTVDADGMKAGQIETPEMTLTDEGIQVTLTGLSPVMIGYRSNSNQSVTEPTEPALETPRSGDSSPVMLWVTVLVLCTAAIVILVVLRKKKH